MLTLRLLVFAALIEFDAEGIGGSGFVECIREHINSVCSIKSCNLLEVPSL